MILEPKAAIGAALFLLPDKMDTAEARVAMYAIGWQESRMVHRRQINGPAKGLWQFESGGGVRGVMNHPASKDIARQIVMDMHIPWDRRAIYDMLEFNDKLAGVFARLLLWTEPSPLPKLGQKEPLWEYYLSAWRPGKPHRKTWDEAYETALRVMLDDV